MTRETEREARSKEQPVVADLPDVPGILTAFRLTPGLATHLRGLADELLVNSFPGSTLTRADRELIATAVSATNDCFYCMDSHGAFAAELLAHGAGVAASIDAVKRGEPAGLEPKLAALVHIARAVARSPRELTQDEIASATRAGASSADTQLAVLIAAGFSMYNRIVDGFRAKTPPSPDAYRARAVEIARHGYSDPNVTAVPR